MKIEIVSDVVCPWCAVGVSALDRALETLGDELRPTLHFEPFELNPDLGAGGRDIVEYLGQKYGRTAAQIDQMHAQIAARGAAVGFTFDMARRTRTYNTFDAHRLLHWAGEVDDADGGQRQAALKRALLRAHFTEGRDPGDADLLVALAAEAGLDADAARAVIDSDAHALAVRERELHWQQMGISSVPSFIINDTHLISGGQPPEVFVQALREIAAGG